MVSLHVLPPRSVSSSKVQNNNLVVRALDSWNPFPCSKLMDGSIAFFQGCLNE